MLQNSEPATTQNPAITDVDDAPASISEMELCAYWGKCPKTLYNLRKAGKIEHYRKGQQVRYLKSVIEKFEQTRPKKTKTRK